MGTIHVGRPEFSAFPAAQVARLDRADAILLEADLSDTARAIGATQKYAVCTRASWDWTRACLPT